MCLAVPGRLTEWIQRDGVFAEAWIEFGGVRRRASMACIPDAELGDYVLVHAGVAISKVDTQEVSKILDSWRDLLDASGQADESAGPP